MWKTAFLAVVLVGFTAAPAAADRLSSEVVVHNRVGKTITLKDKSIIRYNANTAGITDDTVLNPGDRIEIDFAGSEGDMGNIRSITVIPR